MLKTEFQKRQLKFANFEEMMNEINSLEEGGYESQGNWSLAQICGHVADWMRFPIDGFPIPPIYMRPIFFLMKISIGDKMKRDILANGFKAGMPTAPETIPDDDEMTDRQGIGVLKKTIARVCAHTGELLPSPLFGPMDKETLLQVTLLHAEHHLGFLEPKELP